MKLSKYFKKKNTENIKKNIATVSASGDLKLFKIKPLVSEWSIENNKMKFKQQNI